MFGITSLNSSSTSIVLILKSKSLANIMSTSEADKSVFDRTLEVNRNVRKKRRHLVWAIVNLILFCVFAHDALHFCPYYTNSVRFGEVVLAIIFGLNALYHTIQYLECKIKLKPVFMTPAQKKLIGIRDLDSYLKVTSTPAEKPSCSYPDLSPLNLSACSWRSSSMFTAPSPSSCETSLGYGVTELSSPNLSLSSSSWMYTPGSLCDTSQNALRCRPALATTSPSSSPRSISSVEFIEDKHSLKTYLKEFEEHEKKAAVGVTMDQPSNLLSSFWSYSPIRAMPDISPVLRRSLYQLAPSSHKTTSSPAGSDDAGSQSGLVPKQEVWRRARVNPSVLTQWNANLRMWLSQTILSRMVREIQLIDEALQRHGLSDVRVGGVGLERLKKTARAPQVVLNMPTLARIIPFLEITANQEYLVSRIKELAKGGCMSEFKWNGGGTLNGKPWEDHLPTDSAIVMHLLATYLDSQLPPVPQNPDGRPFTSQHFVKVPDKPPKNKNVPIIYQTQINPPHYVVVSGSETFDVGKGHNNFLHTILLFLHLVSTQEHGMLGRVNLGPSGINMLWIIGS
ncbi:transmembrane protein 209 isoform X1 [Bacillus rossius redtenbacheri]|uniref:transmembrane protein 209 isoform X1 n=1 Tax=Bacillus rossius redtenbacheri TaxID=93214 RepID=UPI002FDEBD59